MNWEEDSLGDLIKWSIDQAKIIAYILVAITIILGGILIVVARG